MKNLCSGTQCEGFQFLLILDLWGISFHALIVFAQGKNLLFKSVLGQCDYSKSTKNKINKKLQNKNAIVNDVKKNMTTSTDFWSKNIKDICLNQLFFSQN